MSLSDAARARELEARVVALEQRLTALEQGDGAAMSNAHVVGRINLLQGQINLLRRAAGDSIKSDDAA